MRSLGFISVALSAAIAVALTCVASAQRIAQAGAVDVSAADCAPVPAAPFELASTVNGATVTLQWQAESGACAPTFFIVQVGSAPGLSNLMTVSTGSAATLTGTNVSAGTYHVRVLAGSTTGNSTPSNETIVQVGSGGGTCSAPPAAPFALTSTTTGTTVALSWQASPAATSYLIEAGSSPGASNLAASNTGSAATTFAASGVAPGVYYVRVRGSNACGTSAPSNQVTVSVSSSSTKVQVLSVSVTGGASVGIGQTSRLTATAARSDGSTIDVTSQASWQSSNPAVATVTEGVVTGVARGTSAIIGTFQGKAGGLGMSSGLEPATLSACGQITTSGRYVLTANIDGRGFSLGQASCVGIAADNVTLDCGGLSINTVNVSAAARLVQNVLVTNCTITEYLTTTVAAHVQFMSNRIVNLRNRTISPTAALIFNGGHHNVAMHNDIDGGWDGVSRANNTIGYDDNIAIFSEDSDIIQSNVLRNAWDACFETIGRISNTLIAGNIMSNCGYAGISSYHGTSWIGNVVAGNNISRSGTVAWLVWQDDNSRTQRVISFVDNVFESNVASGIAGRSLLLSFPPSLPLPLNVGNNILRNNVLGTPVTLVPAGAFIDAGGNRF
jgi:hypothetical protein